MARKKYRTNLDVAQPLLLPPRLDEWLPLDHLVYLVLDVVSQLDLSAITRRIHAKDSRGTRPYDPARMTALLFYGYATGRFSSRRLAKACQEDVACRIIMGKQFPHFTVIATFRRTYLEELGALFLQLAQICVRAGFIAGEHIVLDGTKVQASASPHRAMSHERMVQTEARLKGEIEEWMQKAAEADQADDEAEAKDPAPKPAEELSRREKRLELIRAAREQLEQEARAARAAELRERAAEHAKAAEAARAEGDDKEADRKQKLVEKAEQEADEHDPHDDPPPPAAPDAMPQHRPEHRADGSPAPKAQRNFTDPESRIMKTAKGAFDQCFNCQAAVEGTLHLVVAHGVGNQAPDNQYFAPMLLRTAEALGHMPTSITADAGYMSAGNATFAEQAGVEPYLAMNRERRSWPPPEPAEGAPPEGASPQGRMAHRLRTEEGQTRMRKRKSTVELVFGIIKHTMGFRQFLLRGLDKARGEWALVCIAYNVRKIHTAFTA